MNLTEPHPADKTALAAIFAINYYINLGRTYEDIRKQFHISWDQIQSARSVWIDMFPSSSLRQAMNRLPLRLSDAFTAFGRRSQATTLAYRTFQSHLHLYGGPNRAEPRIAKVDLAIANAAAVQGGATLQHGYAYLLQSPWDMATRERVEFFVGKHIRESHRTYQRHYLESLERYISWLLEAKPYDLGLE